MLCLPCWILAPGLQELLDVSKKQSLAKIIVGVKGGGILQRH
ncbi:MAG: hypothetical protein HW380_1572 [Magnetococcales bacterium]|nr:hypothetical protein [Magnetococcales bacterium]